MDFVALSVIACMALLLVQLYDDLSGNWIDRGAVRSANVELPVKGWLKAEAGTAPARLATSQPTGRDGFEQAA
jgi:hypothetical protein